MGLLFFSDGRPSDQLPRGSERRSSSTTMSIHTDLVKKRTGELASICGKRLSVWCLAIGKGKGDDFAVHQSMVETAAKYECPAYFKPASLESGVLRLALRSLTTFITGTMTTIAETQTQENLKVQEFVKMPFDEVGSSLVAHI